EPTPALVVIDMQKGLVAGSVTSVVPNAAALATAFRKHDLPVVLVNVTGRAPGRSDADSRGGNDSIGSTRPFPRAGRTSSTSWSHSRATTGSRNGAAAPST